MVTFGNNGTNSMRKSSKTNQSIATIETNTTNTTVTTSASASSSTTSPTSSSSDSASNSPLNKLSVSDQSFNTIQTNSFVLPPPPQRPSNLSTFTNLNQFRSPRQVVNNLKLPSPPGSPKPASAFLTSQESFETKFLNKLCEEIEVSLNVDCECADDYSVNDFSGDYSFDNSLKSPVLVKTNLPKQNANYGVNSSNLIELRKNFEQNVKNLKQQTKNTMENQSNKSQLGVLV